MDKEGELTFLPGYLAWGWTDRGRLGQYGFWSIRRADGNKWARDNGLREEMSDTQRYQDQGFNEAHTSLRDCE
jgi:hypothetical protein